MEDSGLALDARMLIVSHMRYMSARFQMGCSSVIDVITRLA